MAASSADTRSMPPGVLVLTGLPAFPVLLHSAGLVTEGQPAGVLRGQYPMLVLMVGYTATSLWIIAVQSPDSGGRQDDPGGLGLPRQPRQGPEIGRARPDTSGRALLSNSIRRGGRAAEPPSPHGIRSLSYPSPLHRCWSGPGRRGPSGSASGPRREQC